VPIAATISTGVSFVAGYVEYDATEDRANNQTLISAFLTLKANGTSSSQGTARFRVFIRNSAATEVSANTLTVNTTILNDNVYRRYVRTDYYVPHSSTTGIGSFYVGASTSSGTDPLIGSAWNSLPLTVSGLQSIDFQLYPVVPVFSLQRTSVNLAANTSTVSFLTSPSANITTNTGTVTSASDASLTTQIAKSLTSTEGTYSTFSGSASVSPLERAWIKVTSTADGVTANRTGTSTANVIQTIFGYPSRPTSISLNKVGRQVTVTYGNSATNGGYDTSPTYVIERSLDAGSTWSAHNNSDLLTPAATYIFRVYATNATGSSETRVSESLFLSAYGYRFSGTYPPTPVNLAKIYVGIGGLGADANGWRTVQNAKRYVANAGSGSPGWIDLTT
jgi:hypothetical protein